MSSNDLRVSASDTPAHWVGESEPLGLLEGQGTRLGLGGTVAFVLPAAKIGYVGRDLGDLIA